jgi:hypothetical protein
MADAGFSETTQIRLLVSDTEPVFGDNSDEYIFTDDQINAIYGGVGKNSVLRTAGFLCNTVGNSEALILKVIQTQDLLTNGAQLQASWTKQGAAYIAMADAEDAASGNDSSQNFFQIVDYQQGWDLFGPELTEWSDN